MPILSQPAFGPKLSIGFITGGALLGVWTLVWRYTIAPDSLNSNQLFWFWGLLLTGVTFIVIGALLGSIGQAARKAELPPPEALPAEAKIQANAAANAQPAVAGTVVPAAPAVPSVAPPPAPPVPPAAPPAQVRPATS